MAEAKQRHLSSVRRLAAIMFTDIVGYTKMMSKDEQDTLTILRLNRETHKKLILDFSGQFLKEMGDGILASFENSSDAVVCAAAIQKASKENKIELRIGIHMGEVTFENKDVFGDGVNIASRIQPLAEPNQILISETVHHNVQNKPGITSQLLGERELKNVIGTKAIYIVEVDENYLTPRVRDVEKKSLSPLLMAIMAVAIVIVGFGSYWLGLNSQEPPPVEPIIRYNIDLDFPLGRFGRHSLAFSPDGNYLCYVSNQQLFLKSLDEPGSGLPINGPVDPREPSFSPDGKWIVFEDTRNRSLAKVPVTGGKVQQISSLLGGTYGINWYEQGIIFFQNWALYRVNANGGIPEKIYPKGDSGIVATYIWNPQLLPDGKTVLYNQQDGDRWDVRIVQVESENEPRILIDGGSEARFLNSGYIAFIKDESLQAVRFDPDSRKLIGTPQVLTSDQILGNRQFAFNDHGFLVYFKGTTNLNDEKHMVWIDFSGKTEGITKEPARFGSPRISPDGKQIVTDLIDGDGTMDIAIYNPILGTATNFITRDSVITPVWHPDNTTITYFQINEPRGVYVKPVDLSYTPKLLFETKEIVNLGNWSKDGRYLVFSESENSGNQQENVGYFDVKDSSVHYLDFINTGEDIEVFYPSLSPDGKWLSYCSDDDENQDHLFVVPFPGPGQAHRISIEEGHASVWAQDMKTIYFIGQNVSYNVSRSNIITDQQFASSEPEILFSGNFAARGSFSGSFEIHPDGDRFLMLQRTILQSIGSDSDIDEDGLHLKVVVNWPELLAKEK